MFHHRVLRFLGLALALALVLVLVASREVRAVDSALAHQQVRVLYQQILKREPEPQGLADHTKLVVAGAPLRHVVRAMVTSEEYRTRFMTTATPQELTRRLFQDILGRAPNPGELATHADGIAKHGGPTIARWLADGAEARIRYGDDPPAQRGKLGGGLGSK